MSLSLHIASSEIDAARTTPVLVLNETLHRQLFERGLLSSVQYPLLHRIANWYEDAAYDTDEVERLAVEAERAARSANAILATQLRELASAARRAAAAGLSVYAIAD